MIFDRLLGKSSVEIKRTTQGDTFAVKVYHMNPQKAKVEAEAIYNELCTDLKL